MTDDIRTPLSIWMQFASLFFLLSGLHGDLLIIRFCLFVAYLLLMLNAFLGSPLWPLTKGQGFSMDGLFWGFVGLYVHGSSLCNLVFDERPVHLEEDEAALWRMMYRTGGLSKRLFQTILSPALQVVDMSAGQTIDTDNFFYIVYSGQVRLQVLERNVSKSTRILVSGEMFDLKLIGLFSEKSVFDTGTIRCTALTPVRLFQIAKNDMVKIAKHPLAKGVWQALLINNLSYVVESYMSNNERSNAAEEDQDKIFRPLESWEQPVSWYAGSGEALGNPLLHLLGYVQRSFSPPWPWKGHPTGLRQTQLPPPPHRPLDSQAPPRFHRLQDIHTVGNENDSATGAISTFGTQQRTSSEVDEVFA